LKADISRWSHLPSTSDEDKGSPSSRLDGVESRTAFSLLGVNPPDNLPSTRSITAPVCVRSFSFRQLGQHVHRFLHCHSTGIQAVRMRVVSALPRTLARLTRRILASNRDEYLDRPTAPANWHTFAPLSSGPLASSVSARTASDHPEHPWVISGRDKGSPVGGTWLGMTRDLRLAVL